MTQIMHEITEDGIKQAIRYLSRNPWRHILVVDTEDYTYRNNLRARGKVKLGDGFDSGLYTTFSFNDSYLHFIKPSIDTSYWNPDYDAIFFSVFESADIIKKFSKFISPDTLVEDIIFQDIQNTDLMDVLGF